jgi:hypothetical protein
MSYPDCKENPIYVFLFSELRGLSPNFHIHVSVSDLYIPRIGPHISRQQNRQTDHRYMSVGTERQNITYNSVWKITVSFLGIHKWEPDGNATKGSITKGKRHLT